MKLATLVYRRYLASHGRKKKLWYFLRRVLTKLFDDPPCVLDIHGRPLSLPLSHPLPVYLGQFPNYDRLPRRLGAYIHRRHGHLNCIDVGANIGDTIASFRQDERDTFLAIEPNPKFARYLSLNWGWSKTVTMVRDICSSAHDEGTFVIQEKNGTASIHGTEGGLKMRRRPLDEIVREHPSAAHANVLKIDTDGHDMKVIEGASGLLSRVRPALLFECDAFENTHYVEDCLRILELLRHVGYTHFLLYDNFGHLMGRHSLSEPGSFRDLLFYQLTSRFHYFDILVMMDEDLLPFHREEVEYFTDRMTRKSLQRTALAAVDHSH